ncbi:glypican-6-like [Ornithodoros turicata]|uniref:glypican-6-like n=1 Tax=Ornithodoros turicata TaxID=34597 RepID=UPI0031395CB3
MELQECTAYVTRVNILTLLLSIAICVLGEGDGTELGCTGVKYAFQAKGIEDDVPSQAISGDHLRICQRSMTCCTEELEHKLSAQSREEFDRVLRQEVDKLRHKFSTRMTKFDEFFRELLNTSKRDFHEMFLRTYGMQYDTNSYIFHDMFENLENYYTTGGVDLVEALDGFFQALYLKMFEVLNAQYSFNAKYMQCVAEYKDELKPFGDVPHKLSLEVKRSFVATRTFVQALGIGKDVAQAVMDLGPSTECSASLMKMSYCPHCRGLPDLKPCSSYCHSVMQGCLNHHVQLDTEWSNFIDALLNLANRLETSFNIESVVDPIDIRISDAIMNFQENHVAILQFLYDKCGKPRLGKRGSKHELRFETLKFGTRHVMERPTTAAGTSMDRLVQSFKKPIRNARGFWAQLPSRMCRSTEQQECWDGLRKARSAVNESDAVTVRSQNRKPAQHSDSTLINQLILTLKITTNKLALAYSGQDVTWQDVSNNDDGSGSGSGSGEGPIEADRSYAGSDIFFSVPTSAPQSKHPKVLEPPNVTTAPTASTVTLSGNTVTCVFTAVLVLAVCHTC